MAIKKTLPCKKCKSINIQIYDCGYSSFNPGGGKCKDCGATSTAMCGCFPTQNELIDNWNEGQKPTEMEKLKAENKRLKKELRELVLKNKI